MIRFTEQYFWNILFLLLYVWVLMAMLVTLDEHAYKSYTELSLFDLTLLALASFRVTRLFVYDSMTKFIREQFLDVKTVRGKEVVQKPEGGMRRTLADLVCCPWCFGIWATTCVVFFYLLTPLAYLPILILALAGVATFLQLCANVVGWKAEQLKREVER